MPRFATAFHASVYADTISDVDDNAMGDALMSCDGVAQVLSDGIREIANNEQERSPILSPEELVALAEIATETGQSLEIRQRYAPGAADCIITEATSAGDGWTIEVRMNPLGDTAEIVRDTRSET